MASLTVLNGAAAGTRLNLRRGTLRIGRLETNDYHVSDPSVSGVHCEIALDEAGNLLVRDLGSTNGLFVEGQRTAQALLKPGQVVRLGLVELRFEGAGDSAFTAARTGGPMTAAPEPAPTLRVEAGTEPQVPGAGAPPEAGESRRDAGPPEPDRAEDLTVSYVVKTRTGAFKAPFDAAARATVRASFAAGVVVQERYELERELGRGSMGQVFLARDLRLERAVALKVIATGAEQAGPGSALRPEARDAFEAEAQIGARLNHPAIATVFDYGFHQSKPFIVFEYMEGETLQTVLGRRRRVPLEEVRLMVAPLAQALDHAHAHQIVHRDLKPANIRATAQGDFKILDLGLAKQITQADDWQGFAGTPAYASPEQAAERPLDGRTDQYALGLIVYEMLTGEIPFPARSPYETLRLRLTTDPPDPKRFAPDLPDEVGAALQRVLARDPNHRFPSCEAFAAALGCQLLALPAAAPPILLEADVRNLDWFSSAWEAIQRRIHLALVPGALWIDDGQGIECWALDATGIGAKSRASKALELEFPGHGLRRFRFARRQECQTWRDGLARQLRAGRPKASGLNPIRRPPVFLLRQKPDVRFQLLGQVEAEGKARPGREAALRMHAALLGADAVTDLDDQATVGAARTVRRMSGTAVRTVDAAGRLQVQRQWLNAQVCWSVVTTVKAVGLLLFAAWMLKPLVVCGLQSAGLFARDLSWIACFSWPLALTLLLSRLRWPQLLPAATVNLWTFLALPFLGYATMAFFYVQKGDEVGVSQLGLRFGGGLGAMVGGFVIASGISRNSRSLRLALAGEGESPPAVRRWAGRLALAGSLGLAVLLTILVVRGGLHLAASRATSTQSLAQKIVTGNGVQFTPTTNDLADIGVSWVLDSSWHEETNATLPGLQHTLISKRGMMATAFVQRAYGLPPRLRADHGQLLQATEEWLFRYVLDHRQQLADSRPVQIDGAEWRETQFKAAFAAQPNGEFTFLLRAHAEPTCHAAVLVGCPAVLWDEAKDMVKTAADGLHFTALPPARRLTPPASSIRSTAYQWTKPPYAGRLPGDWRRDPSQDGLVLVRGNDLVFAVLLEDYSAQLPWGVSLPQAEAGLVKTLANTVAGFLLHGSEDVEVAGRRGRLLRFAYQEKQQTITEWRVLVMDSGWLYHLRVFTTHPSPEHLALMEQALGGIEL